MLYIFISIFLDFLFSLFISSTYQNLNIFFPCIFVSCIPLVYNLLNNKKIFIVFMIFIGIVYDLLFSDIFLINTYYFLLFGLFIYVYYSKHKFNLFNIFFLSLFGVCLYDIFIFFILVLIDYRTFTIFDLIYKVKNSILLNSIYILLSIICLKSRIFRNKNSKRI